jgi:hypothetical protein
MFIYRNQILQKMATSYCLLQTKMETAIYFCLFAANRNEKMKFVFLGRQTIQMDADADTATCDRSGFHKLAVIHQMPKTVHDSFDQVQSSRGLSPIVWNH